jgi:tRNA (pseudouridine54-N1)-methyltransferase
MRRFVIVGQRASASPQFSLEDLPSSSGRLDVLLRCLRAALLVSHGLRRDTAVYLVLEGGDSAPRTLRFDGATARFVRPDERSLAVLVKKTLAAFNAVQPGFVEVREGVAAMAGGIAELLAEFELAPGSAFVLEEAAPDLRTLADYGESPLFFVGDHLGFDAATRAALSTFGATPVGVGPLSLHAEDAISVMVNELDRRQFTAR